MNRYLYYCLLIVAACFTHACRMQVPELTDDLKKSVSHGDSLHLFYIPYADQAVKTRDDRVYFGYRFGDIHATQGAVVGAALHGEYELFYQRKLVEKGAFQQGIKTGAWSKWDENGQLLSVTNYQHGKKDGLSKRYNGAGDVVSFQQYRKDVKQGIGLYEQGGEPVYFKYKNDMVTDTLESLTKAQQLKYGLTNIR